MTSDRGPPRGLRATGRSTAFDLVIVGPGPGDPRDGDDPKIAAVPARRSTTLLAAGQPFLAVCLGHQALCHRLGIPLAFKDIVFQGTQSPVVHRRPRPSGSASTTPSSAGSATGAPAGGRHGRGRPGDRRHPPGVRAALPRHPVPRRVDPHRARLRPDPRPGARPAGLTGARLARWPPRTSWSWTTTTPTPGTWCTWSPRSPACCPTVVQHDEVGPEEVLAHSHVVLSPGPGHPDDPADFAVGREVLLAGTRPVLGVCLGMQGLVTAYGGTVRRVAPAHGEVALRRPRRRGRVRGLPQRLRGGALPLARPPPPCPTCSSPPRGPTTTPGGDGRAAPVAAAGGRAVPPRVDPVRARRQMIANFLDAA